VSGLAGPTSYLLFVGRSWGIWDSTSLAAVLGDHSSLTPMHPPITVRQPWRSGTRSSMAWQQKRLRVQRVMPRNNDLTGRNGELCSALRGYDMSVGLGTPDGSALSTHSGPARIPVAKRRTIWAGKLQPVTGGRVGSHTGRCAGEDQFLRSCHRFRPTTSKPHCFGVFQRSAV
jgi:hypothetical protein